MGLDRLPVSQAQAVVGFSKSRFYEALKELSITPVREGRASFLPMDAVETLVNFRQWVKQYGSPNGFPGYGKELAEPEPTIEAATETGMVKAADDSRTFSGFHVLMILEYAYTWGWWLTTSQLSELLGFSKHWFRGDLIQVHGFELKRRSRLGNQYQWQIGKVAI